MSKYHKQFEALEKARTILQINEKDGLAVEAKWLKQLPIYDKKDLSIDFVTYNFA